MVVNSTPMSLAPSADKKLGHISGFEGGQGGTRAAVYRPDGIQTCDEEDTKTGWGGRQIERTALNDVVISRGIDSRLIELEVCVDKDMLTRYRCDGLIVSSPTGSTAYSLAAGGAVIFPTAQVLALTPICPHTLSNRALILPHDAIIDAKVISPKPVTILSADGQLVTELSTGDCITVSRSRQAVVLMHLAGSSFCETLRRKLHWRGGSM